MAHPEYGQFWVVTFKDKKADGFRQPRSKRYFSLDAMRNACNGRQFASVEVFSFQKLGERDKP